MPKKPKLRVNYKADAQYLLRLVHALEHDPHRPSDWRRRAIELTQQLAYLFLQEPNGQEAQEAREEAQEESYQAGIRAPQAQEGQEG